MGNLSNKFFGLGETGRMKSAAAARLGRHGGVVAAAFSLLFAAAPGAHAANFSCGWTDAGDNWTTAGDWSGCNGASPNNGGGNTYDATISTGSPSLTSAISIGNVTVNSSGAWYVRGANAAATLSGNLTNSGSVELDPFGGDGGASLNVGGALTNSNFVQIGNTALSANTTLSATALSNTGTGTIDIYGNGANQAALKVSGAAGFGAAGVISGQVNLQNNSLVQFGSGGLTSIASGGQLALNGAGAQVQIAGNTANNNALSGLSSNAGFLYLRNGASLATTTGLDNSSNLELDPFGGDGGATLNVGGALTNSNLVQIGNTALSADTTLSATAVSNTGTGTIDLFGNGASQAALKIAGAAGFGTAGVVSGQVDLNGNNLVQFGSGGLTGIAAGGQLALDGGDSQVQILGNSANNNALTGLASNAGLFYLRNGASLTTTTGLDTSNQLLLDIFGGDGGASLGVGGTLTNNNYVQIGNTALSANSTLSANAVDNTGTGTIDLFGNGASQAALKIAGAAGFGAAGVVSGQVNLQNNSLV
ncbi:MAG: beta strand repeat-containing protein, partial [Stellaceae bacterium]